MGKRRNTIGRWLFYANRGRQYLGLLTATFIFVLWADSRGINIDWWMYPLLILAAALCLVIAGFVDVKVFKFRQSEVDFAEKNNPFLIRMSEDIKELKEKL